MIRVGSGVDALIASIPELKSYEVKINNNTIDISMLNIVRILQTTEIINVTLLSLFA